MRKRMVRDFSLLNERGSKMETVFPLYSHWAEKSRLNKDEEESGETFIIAKWMGLKIETLFL